VSDSPTVPESTDPERASRQRFYRVVRSEPGWAAGELIPLAMGTLRSLAEVNHRDLAQEHARKTIAQIDAAVMAKGKELGLWRD